MGLGLIKHKVYLWDDVSMNPEIYEDPYKWDPGRYEPQRAEDKKVPHGYIGWGSGRHPCCKFPHLNEVESELIRPFPVGMRVSRRLLAFCRSAPQGCRLDMSFPFPPLPGSKSVAKSHLVRQARSYRPHGRPRLGL